MYRQIYFLAATIAAIVHALPHSQLRSPIADSLVRVIHAFPNGTWVENIAPRANGKLSVTLVNLPEVWEVDPWSQSARLVHSFPDANVTLGIAEVDHDVFAVAVGAFTAPGKGVPGSWSIWKLDFQSPIRERWWGCSGEVPSNDSVASKVVGLPAAVFLNGLSALPSKAGTILVGDSFNGEVYVIDIRNGRYSVAIDDPAFKPNSSAGIVLGINGLHVKSEKLYFMNSEQAPLLASIPLTSDGHAAGPVEVIAKSAVYPLDLGFQSDDFAIDLRGEDAWMVSNPSGVLVKINLTSGQQQIVLGGVSDSTIAGATSAAFGRTEVDDKVLYIVTDGGAVDPGASGLRGGQVLALDTTKL
jgi:hypothetical protein